jgi:hypothetical protein
MDDYCIKSRNLLRLQGGSEISANGAEVRVE